MVPSDRIAQSKESTRLGASLPEDRNTASFQKSCLFKRVDDGRPKKDCVSLL